MARQTSDAVFGRTAIFPQSQGWTNLFKKVVVEKIYVDHTTGTSFWVALILPTKEETKITAIGTSKKFVKYENEINLKFSYISKIPAARTST